jgi:hypothetical protein
MLHTSAKALDLATLVGKPVTEFLPRLCLGQPNLIKIRLAAYTPEPRLSDRLRHSLTPEETELRDQATATCHGNGIPFWDALLGICMKRDSIPERILDSAANHTSAPPAFEWTLQADQVSPERISKLIADLPTGLGIVVSSRVLVENGDTAHIPMLDFRCPESPANRQAVRKILQLLGQKRGIIVASGRSYHYYGIQLLSPADWITFLARSLLFAPIVDPRYIAHRLADGECRLKLAASKQTDIPQIIDAYSA